VLRRLEAAVVILLLIVIVVVGYRLARSRVEIEIYRDRLADLSRDYEALRSIYNEAVARSAVTELLVEKGKLSVVIRTIEGVERVIETPFDPSREIYCDYVVADGRIWIRRVYDDHTPPREGLVIDESLRYVDWDDPAARYGKAIYRSLDEGRWIVTVTGGGSLGLAKAPAAAEVVLSPPAPVRDYEEMEKEIGDTVRKVGAVEVLRRVISPDE